MLNPLFTQLFGREMVDRLARAGFESSEGIAKANAEVLAGTTGIPLVEARRVIALAGEDLEAAPKTQVERPRTPARAAKRTDPYVDDPALIAWMGSALTPQGGRPCALSVTDAILDPDSPAIPFSRKGAKAKIQPEPKKSDPPREVVTLEEAFWSFGRTPAGNPQKKPTGPRPETRTPGTQLLGGRSRRSGDLFNQRRRDHDGH